MNYGARSRNRTGTAGLGPGDFKSPVSTCFTIRARQMETLIFRVYNSMCKFLWLPPQFLTQLSLVDSLFFESVNKLSITCCRKLSCQPSMLKDHLFTFIGHFG